MEQDPVESAPDETSGALQAKTQTAVYSGQGNGEALHQSAAKERVDTQTTGASAQIDGVEACMLEPASQDKGKATAIIDRDLSDGAHPNHVEASDAIPHMRTYTSVTLNLPNLHSRTETRKKFGWSTYSPALELRAHGRMSRKRNLESSLEHPASTANESDITSEVTEAPVFRPLQYGDPGWEKSTGRPPKKLPVRFKDAGMERLIRSCFVHVPVIGPHVIEGHYDLGEAAPPEVGTAAGPQAASSPSGPVPQAPIPPPAAAPSAPAQQSAVIILPEVWEDLVEPGMAVEMFMWPRPPSGSLPLPPLPLPPPPFPPQHVQHAPVGPAHPLAPGFVGGRGRGLGRGRGRGMGPAPSQTTLMWIMGVEPPKPRGKTRKRQNGS
ncbi:hypothetical protein AAE478_006668 [Parahypoxylon ruwenzoriense]